MVYNYVCKFPKTLGENVRKAIQLVREQHYTHRQASEATGVTRSVLEKYLKKRDDEIPEVLSQGRFKPVFNQEQEKIIIFHCHDLANKFYAMTRKSLGQLAFSLAEENNLPHPFRNGTAGDEWICSFLIRHQKELTYRTGTPTSLIRITSFTKPAVHRFFDQLEELIAENNYTAATIFNADETGITIVPNKTPKRIAKTGVRTVPVMTPVERGQLVSMMCCASARGQFIPPMFVFANNCKDTDISLSPSGSIFTYSAKGWSTMDTFCVWIKHFRNHATHSKTTRILLIIDNHGSHISYQAVKFAAKHNIDILTLPPHTTHKLQPMDVAFFSPLKANYGQVLTEWEYRNRGLKPRTECIPWIIKPAYEDACKEETIINGFRKTGIWDNQLERPNRHVFIDSDFVDTPMETDVPNQDQNQESQPLGNPISTIGQNRVQDFIEDNESSVYSPTYNADQREQLLSPVDNRSEKVTSLVPYYGSSSDEEDEESFSMVSVGIQVNLTEIIHFGEEEVIAASDEIQVILPASTATTQVTPTPAFKINPWDLDKPGPSTDVVPPTRKPRAKGTSEVITSKENIKKLQEKDKKRKKLSSDSEETVRTRSQSKSATRTLRSSSKSGSSSQ